MKRYRRNELQAREGIDTLSYMIKRDHRIQSRNELQAREGIDTLLSYVLECSTSLHVEMSYKPERALTPRRNLNILSSLYEVEMSYKPERALTHDFKL